MGDSARRFGSDSHAAPFLLALVLLFLGYSGLGDQPVAEHHPAGDLDLGRGRAAAKHGLHAGRRAVHHPIHPRLHRWSYYVFRGKVRAGEGYH